MVLYVTAHTPSNEKIFEETRIYMPQSTDSLGTAMVLGPDKKLGLVRDTSLQPFAAKEETFEIPMPGNIKEARVSVELSYQPRPGDVYPIHSVARSVALR